MWGLVKKNKLNESITSFWKFEMKTSFKDGDVDLDLRHMLSK
jgi:hypothetical protein